MKPGLYILADNNENLFSSLEPEELSGKNFLWADDVRRFAPWSKTRLPGSSVKAKAVNAWRSGPAVVESTSLYMKQLFKAFHSREAWLLIKTANRKQYIREASCLLPV